MQEISKLEQPISPSNSRDDDLMQNITKVLEKGQESAEQIRKFFHGRLGLKVEDDHHQQQQQSDVDHHSWVTLNSFETCLSMLKTYDFDLKKKGDFIRKRKINPINHDDLHSKFEDTSGGTTTSKEKRGTYKRRRTGLSWTVEASNLMDDGYAWRKYGQKEILHTKFPRNYYRCTHKNDQDCQAKKQVQQISENPNKYTIIYHGNHTCENQLKNPTIILDSPEENSSFFLSFGTNNYPTTKHAPNTSLFPSSSSSFHTTMVKQEHTSIKLDSLSAPHDLHHHHHHHHHHHQSGIHNQYSSSSDNYLPSSSDLTSTGLSSTPVSDQSDVISSAEIYSSTPMPYDMDDALFSSLIDEFFL